MFSQDFPSGLWKLHWRPAKHNGNRWRHPYGSVSILRHTLQLHRGGVISRVKGSVGFVLGLARFRIQWIENRFRIKISKKLVNWWFISGWINYFEVAWYSSIHTTCMHFCLLAWWIDYLRKLRNHACPTFFWNMLSLPQLPLSPRERKYQNKQNWTFDIINNFIPVQTRQTPQTACCMTYPLEDLVLS